jgi:hypothetical protein
MDAKKDHQEQGQPECRHGKADENEDRGYFTQLSQERKNI